LQRTVDVSITTIANSKYITTTALELEKIACSLLIDTYCSIGVVDGLSTALPQLHKVL